MKNQIRKHSLLILALIYGGMMTYFAVHFATRYANTLNWIIEDKVEQPINTYFEDHPIETVKFYEIQ